MKRTERRPVRVAHLGLGAFHRAHQAWYTEAAGEAGIAAFTGRRPDAARALAAQDALYTLIERGPEGDHARLVQALSAVYDGADIEAWHRVLADPEVGVLTLTITEAGYAAGSGAPERVLDGLRARFNADAGGIAVVSCDNLPDNGTVIREAVFALPDAHVDSDFEAWLGSEVSFVSSMVDRITPASTDPDRETVRRLTGWVDAAPVVTEPYSEWVLAGAAPGAFPVGRPNWEAAGARFVTDIAPSERRKLWLLNAGHSLLAYRGLAAGHTTVAEAVADSAIAEELERLWSEQRAELSFDAETVDAALAALRSRFGNARIEHRLSQIAADGSQKLGPRILDPLRSRLAAGRTPGDAQLGVLVAWAAHLAAVGPEGIAASDSAAASLAERLRNASPTERAAAVLAALDGLTGDDRDLSEMIDPLAERMAARQQGAPA